jgi:hypothetical protein
MIFDVPTFVPASPPVRLMTRRRASLAVPVLGTIVAVLSIAATLFVLSRLGHANPDELSTISQFMLYAGLRLLSPFGPLVIPSILARRGVLSMGRWLVMAGVCLSFTVIAIATIWTISLVETPQNMAANFELGKILGFSAGAFAYGIPGCLLAAALYKPKV